MSTYPLAALQVQPPKPIRPLESLSLIMQLRGAQQEMQMRQQEMELRKIELQDAKAASAAMQDWDGKDYDALPGLILKHGGSAKVVFGTKQQITKLQQELATKNKTELENEKVKNDYFAQAIENVQGMKPEQQPAAFELAKTDAVTRGYLTPQQAQQYSYQGPEQLDLLKKTFLGHEAALATALKQQQTKEAEARTAQVEAQMPGGSMYSPTEQALTYQASQGNKTAQAALAEGVRQKGKAAYAETANRVAAETSPSAIRGQAELARAKSAATGGNEQVYAINAQRQTVLMSKADAVEKGYSYTKVSSHQVTEDRQLNNRLADVNLKLGRYENALAPGRLTQADKDAMALIIRDDKFKMGVFGIQIPVDQLNNILRAYRIENMSEAGKHALVAYYNARESMVGYQRVLSGSGRSSDQAMELNLNALPEPYLDPAYQKESLTQFRENIRIAAQGMPVLPGIKTPEEIERETMGPKIKLPQMMTPEKLSWE